MIDLTQRRRRSSIEIAMSGSPRASTASAASTTTGSNCVPALARSSAIATPRRQRLAVGRRVVIALYGVGDRDDARGERDLRRPRSAVGVAAAVVALVRGAHDRADVVQRAADAVEHPLAGDRVLAHRLPLLVVQRAGLVEDLLRRRPSCRCRAASRRTRRAGARSSSMPQLVGDRQRERDDALAVRARVLVVLGEHVAEQQRRAAVGGAQLDRRADPLAPLAREDRQQQRRAAGRAGRRSARRCSRSAASSPIGDSSASTSQTSRSTPSWSFGRDAVGEPLAQRRAAAGRRRTAPRARAGRAASRASAGSRDVGEHEDDGRADARTTRRPTTATQALRVQAPARARRAVGRARAPRRRRAARSPAAARTASARR